jgi:hypothetical protein
MSPNKSLIIDITGQKSFVNLSTTATIIYDINALIWGRNEFMLKGDELRVCNSYGNGPNVYFNGS